GIREDLKKSTLGAEELESLRTEIKNLKSATPQASRDNTNPALTVDSVKSIVEQTITQAERNRTAQQNILSANDAMVKQYGSLDKAAEAVKARAAEVGMTVEALRSV